MLNSAQWPNLTGYPLSYMLIYRKFTISISHDQAPIWPCSSVGRAKGDLFRKSWVRTSPGSEIFSLSPGGPTSFLGLTLRRLGYSLLEHFNLSHLKLCWVDFPKGTRWNCTKGLILSQKALISNRRNFGLFAPKSMHFPSKDKKSKDLPF